MKVQKKSATIWQGLRLSGDNFVNLNDYWSKKIEEHLDGKYLPPFEFVIMFYTLYVIIQ